MPEGIEALVLKLALTEDDVFMGKQHSWSVKQPFHHRHFHSISSILNA